MIRYSLAIDIPDDVLDGRIKKANAWLQEEIIKDTDQFVPALTGALSTNVHRDGNAIVYAMPYARYLYYGKLMIDPETGSSYARKGSRKALTDKNLVFNKSMHPQATSHWFEVSKAVNEEKWEQGVKKILADK